MPHINRFADLHPEITAWRRDLHEHPELLFDTERTSAIVTDKLTEFGCDQVKGGIGRTGIVAVIKGKTNHSGKVIGLRADMDALPIFEATGLEYKSKTEGKMHACGHDGHTAMLLGAAKYLAETRNFDGTAVMIFQPAEEGGGGGREMCADGMMEEFGIQQVYGMHNMPGFAVGEFAIRPGAFFAAADQFTIDLEGKGGHAAKPQEAVDTTLVGAQIVVAMQSVVARNADPLKSLVISITSFRTESDAYNVIPQRVQLRGTVRTMDMDVQDMAEEAISRVALNTAEALGAKAVVTYERGYPVMVNSEEETAFAVEVAEKVAGKACVIDDAPQIMGAEDFSYMLQERPGAYILVGNGDTPMCHHPEYNFDDEAIPAGCSYWATLVETAMPSA